MATKNYYRILEVSPRAGLDVIQAAWKTLSRRAGQGSKEQMLLNEAFGVLSDDSKRAAYDLSLRPPEGQEHYIGNYRILGKIAEGAMGATYRAEHNLCKELVCIKRALYLSPLDEEIMLEEAKALWNLRHWALPAVRDVLRLEDESIAIVMSYIPGRNLQKHVEEKGPVKPEDVSWMAERILNALGYLRDNGTVHGDVKPANIIPVFETHQASLVDFGLSLVKPGRNTANKGYTRLFASPEQLAGRPILPESDLYSLALTMIYALGGDPAGATIPRHVPTPLRDFIERLLVRDVRNRPRWGSPPDGENLCTTLSDVRLAAFGRRGYRETP